MPNIKISDLETIAPGFDPDLVFVELQATVAGEDVSRKATVSELTAGTSPLDATYVTVTANAILPNERILTGDANIDITDGGAGLAITVSMADMAQATVKGRADGAGTGIPVDLTAAQLNAILASGGFDPYFLLSATGRVLGSDAGTSNTGDNVILGGALAGDLNIADGVIALGQNALAAAAELDFVGSIAIGRNAGALIGDTRDPWVIIGDGAAGNVQPRSFHDGNTIIGTRALGALAATATVQNTVIIGHDAMSDMTGASGLGVTNNTVAIGANVATGNVGASVTTCVIIGSNACNDLQPGGITGGVVIGNAAGERLGGSNNAILIGSNNTQNAINVDDCIVIGCNTFGIGSSQTATQILIGHSGFSGLLAGEKNVLIGNALGITGTQIDFDGSIIIGHQAAYNMIDDQDIFAIETPQGSTSGVARPYLFGNILNGNLALLNIAAMTGGSETGTRIVPAWADAAPVAGQGVFSMYGAGTDLAATTDTDFVHFYVRSSDNNMMFRFEDGTEIALNSAGFAPAAGVLAVRSVGNTDTEARELSYQHADGTQRAFTGHDVDDVFNIANQIDGGNVEISATDAVSGVITGFIFDPDTTTTVRGDTGLVLETTGGPTTVGIAGTVQHTLDVDGQFFVNTLTGAVDAQGSNIVSATPDKVSIFAAGSATNGVNGGNVEIWGGYAAGLAPANGGNVRVWGGGGGGGPASGGDVNLIGGEADGSPGDVTLIGGTATVAGNGGAIDIQGAPGFGAGARMGGGVDISAGDGVDTGRGGDTNLLAGDGSTTARGGIVTISGGIATSAVGGLVLINGGAVQTTGVGGRIQLLSGDGGAVSDAGGDLWLLVGQGDNTGASGNIYINSTDGLAPAALSTQSPGLVAMFAIGGQGITAGDFEIHGGLSQGGATGDGGNILLESGSTTATNGDGGDVFLTVGTGNGSGVDGEIITTGALRALNAAGPAFLDEAATGTNPTLIPNRAELDTGIGWTSADRISVVSGGSIVVEFLNTAGVEQIIIPLQSNAATPSLAFGDGDTGLYETVDDAVNFSNAGADKLQFGVNSLSCSVNADSFTLLYQSSGPTTPVFVPDKADTNTGVGHGANDDELALVAGGLAALQLVELNSNALQVPDAQVGLTAFATGGQGSATQVNASYAQFSTVATLNDSAKLPPVFKVGSIVTVKNDGAADMSFFPATGDDLGAGTNTSVQIVAGTAAQFLAISADATWTQIF